MMSSTMRPPESIYNVIPREEDRAHKPPRYMSKFRAQVKQEKQLNTASKKTMGPAKVEVPLPDEYLLKHSKEPRLPEKKSFSRGDEKHPRKPPLPSKTDRPTMGIQTKKDFVKTNVVENTMAVPRYVQAACADTKRGDKQLLENSGLVPKYVKKKDYGQTPEYLQQRQEELRMAREEYNDYMNERMKERAMKQFTEEERRAVLQGLKKNWDDLHHQYQGLSVVTDTAPKKQRKERLEMEMKQLEKDIELIERHKIIYITNN